MGWFIGLHAVERAGDQTIRLLEAQMASWMQCGNGFLRKHVNLQDN
jgi:hypothetical protein